MKEITAFGKLISDPTRLKITKLLSAQPMCVCELMEILNVNQPCISQHLTILKYHNLINSKREGKWIVYKINNKELNRYLKEIASFIKKPISKNSLLRKEHRKLENLKERGLLCQKLKYRKKSD